MKPMTTQILPNPRLTLLIAGLTFGLVAAAQAQMDSNGSPGQSTASPTLAHRDRSFLEKFAQASTEELTLSQLAADHSQNSDVKDFAAKMVSDHTELNSKLLALASKKGVAVEDDVTKGQQNDDVSDLAKKSGPDFDKAYVKLMVKGHTDAVGLFKAEGGKSKDSDLAGFANDNVMAIQHHLDMAEALQQKVNP